MTKPRVTVLLTCAASPMAVEAIQALQASPLYGRDMHEDILTAVIGGNEAISLCVVEPFYLASNNKKTEYFDKLNTSLFYSR